MDNGDGAIDLCDIPDVIVQTVATFDFGTGTAQLVASAYMSMLAGDSGKLEVQFDDHGRRVRLPRPSATSTVTASPRSSPRGPSGNLVAYDNKGHLKWTGERRQLPRRLLRAVNARPIAIYDLDGDGNPEILFGWEVYDNHGKKLWGRLAVDPHLRNHTRPHTGATRRRPRTSTADGKARGDHGQRSLPPRRPRPYWSLPKLHPRSPARRELRRQPAEPAGGSSPTRNGITLVNHDGSVVFKEVSPRPAIRRPRTVGASPPSSTTSTATATPTSRPRPATTTRSYKHQRLEPDAEVDQQHDHGHLGPRDG